MKILRCCLYAVAAALLPFAANAEAECEHLFDQPFCFGTNWETATPEDVARMDVDQSDQYGRTPLHWAAYWSSDPVVEALLEAGASVNTRADEGSTPLDLAKRKHSKGSRIIEVLLEAGAQ